MTDQRVEVPAEVYEAGYKAFSKLATGPELGNETAAVHAATETGYQAGREAAAADERAYKAALGDLLQVCYFAEGQGKPTLTTKYIRSLLRDRHGHGSDHGWRCAAPYRP